MIGDTATPDGNLLLTGDEAGTAPEDRRFRPDVQGLRAVAVVLVVLFHAHVPGLSGGYVGVDVFFVISGFVITGVLLRERVSTGSTSILSFYGRRVRRIIPAATLVILAAVIASYVLLGSLSGNQTAGDARWASVFLINIHFASTGTNYLSSQLPPSVLQNYWSLAVEEQFYLVYPAIFLAVATLSRGLSLRRRLGFVLGVAVVVSFVASIIQTKGNPTAAYFSPLPRVWELALGGLVALGTVSLRRLPPRGAALLSWIGLGAVLTAAFAFSSSTAYPGWAVAVPVVGSALVIAGGVAKPAYGAESLLKLRPFQWMGLISYSLYLWHWPVLTMAAQHSRTGTLSVWDSLWWLLVSLGLAIVTYLLLENPIRHSRPLITRRWASLVLGGCLIASSLTVATVELHLHDTGTLATPGLASLATSDPCPPPSQAELSGLLGSGPAPSHRVVARILLVGDSTACTMVPGLEAVGAPAGVRIENAAVIGCGVVNGSSHAVPGAESRRREARALRSGRPNIVLWASAWERTSLVVGSGGHEKVLTAGSPQWYAVMRKRMHQRVRAVRSHRCDRRYADPAPVCRLRKSARPDHAGQGLRAPEHLVDRIRSADATCQVDQSRRICLPLGAPLPAGRGRLRPARRRRALHQRRLALCRAMAHASTRHRGTRQTGQAIASDADGQTGHWDGPQGNACCSLPSRPSASGLSRSTSRSPVPSVSAVVGASVYVHNTGVSRWDTTSVPNGTYTVRSVAYGAAGARSVSKGITVKVAN